MLHETFGAHLDGADAQQAFASWVSGFGRAIDGPDPLRWDISMSDSRDPYFMEANMQAFVVPGPPVSWGNGWMEQPHKPSLVLSVPLAFSDLSLEQVAGGAADSQYQAGFAHLANAGFPQVVLRLGWEQGGPSPATDWMPWDKPYDPSAYVAAYRHVHDLAVRAIPGARFEWNTADPISGTASYPGDDVVDVVGWDVYRRPADPAGFGGGRLAQYQAAVALAESHGKQVGFSEFGLNVDDPSFVSGFCANASQLASSGVGSLAYWSLFQGTPGDGLVYNIYQFPNALAELRTCVGPP